MKKLLLTTYLVLFPFSAQAQMTSAACQLLEKHVPADNVAHKGNADINAASNIVPEIIKVPLNIDLAKRVAALAGTGIELDAPLGMMEIHSDGQITYNGQDWTAPVMTLCGKSHVIKEMVEVEAPVVETSVKAESILNNDSILNKSHILNTTPIINRKPAGERVGEISKVMEITPEALETGVGRTAGTVSKATGDMMEALPAKVKLSKPAAMSASAKEAEEVITRGTREDERTIKEASDLIEGGEYKDIYYNE